MCFGPELLLLAAGTGMSMAGSAMQRREEEKNAAAVARARNQELFNFLDRSRQFQDENQVYLDRVNNRYEQPEQEKAQTEAVDKRTADTTANMTAPDVETIPLSGNAPKIIKGAIAQRMLDAFNESTDLAKRRAKLGAYEDVWLGNNLLTGDASRRIDTTNSFARAESALLPSQMDFAGYAAHRPSSGIGQILSAGGQLVAGMGGSGGFRMPGMTANYLTGVPLPRPRPVGI